MRRPRLSYTNVVATAALFTALGGSAYAAATITGSQVRNGTLTGADLKNESVKGRDVDNGTLTGSDVKAGSVTSSDIGNESLESADVAAGQAPAGPAGAPGPTGTTQAPVRRAADVLLTHGSSEEATASCEAGEVAVGGGAGHSGLPDDSVVMLSDEPVEADGTPPEAGEPATGWHAAGLNVLLVGPPQVVMSVYVLCAKGS